MTPICSRSSGRLGSIALSLSFIFLSACGSKPDSASVAPSVRSGEPGALAVGSDPAYPEIDVPPVWASDGKLVQPKNFREMVFIGAPLTPNGLNDGKANFPEFHNVYVQRAAFKAYRATGKWPEGTMMIKELQLVDDPKGEFPDGSRTLPSGRGYFPGPVNGLDVSVKDSKRFSATKNWGYFNFKHSAPPYLAAAAEKPAEECASCHVANAHEDMVYVNLYKPILTPLPVAAN
ncbi:cytochrome P460 family protein [Phenylobacterium sp.]|uniref:cytochrome P460 family protein n=1 Tax=Phenylobacterium sp. TaxID=1871053 RepID=UPI003BAAA280